MTAVRFTSTIDLPDGRRITSSIEVPEKHPAGLAWEHVGENSEIAHMGAVHVLRVTLRGDEARARHEREAIDEMNADIVSNLYGKAPF
jgi:hypothetical protein